MPGARAIADYMQPRRGDAAASQPDGVAPGHARGGLPAPLPSSNASEPRAARTPVANGAGVGGVMADVIAPAGDAGH